MSTEWYQTITSGTRSVLGYVKKYRFHRERLILSIESTGISLQIFLECSLAKVHRINSPAVAKKLSCFFYRQTDSKCPARAMDYCDDQGKKDYTALCRDKVCQLAIKNSYSGQHLLQIKRNTDIHLAAHGCTRNCGLIEKGLNKKKKTIMWNKINAIHQPHREPKQLHE